MRSFPHLSKKPTFWLFLALLLNLGLKVWLIIGQWVPFNSDEAVVALMARHIRQGAIPTFFYGQAYMGSLDAYIVAGAFSLFGEHVWSIRLVQVGLHLCFLGTVFLLGRAVYGGWQVGTLAVLLLAVPTVNLSLYTTVSLGGYGEALLIGCLIWLLSINLTGQLDQNRSGNMALWGLLGILIGLGLWAFGLTLVYSLPAGIFLLWRSLRRIKQPNINSHKLSLCWVLLVVGFVIGSLPWWTYAMENGFSALLGELVGGAIVGVEGLPWFNQVQQHLANLLLFGTTVIFGLRPPWSIDWLVIPLLPAAVSAWIVVLAASFRNRHTLANRRGLMLMESTAVTLVLAFIFSPFGADPSGRYFLPLAALLALSAAHGVLSLRRGIGKWAWGIAGLLIVYQLAGNIQAAHRFPPGITTQFYAPSQIDHRYDAFLINFLKSQGETTGYSNYWVSYPLAFLSQEEIRFAPRLPYHLDLRYTARDDRLPEYTRLAAVSSKTAYITTRNPNLDMKLKLGFSRLGITWSEIQIGDYHVYYALSMPVHPGMLGLGDPASH